MKVLHVYRTFFPDTQGGLEEVIRQLCLTTRAHQVESRVFVLSPQPEPARVEVDGIEVIRVKQTFEIASCGFCFAGIREFRRQVEWADLVHYHFPWPWGDVLYMLAGRSRPSVVTYHSDIVRQQLLQYVYHPLMYRFLGSAARIVATSPNYYATSDVLNQFSDRVEIIPIGIDEDYYPPANRRQAAIEEVSEHYGEGFFLFVGVLRYYKGLHILLEAARNASYRVVIVGSGPVEAELQAQAQALGLNNVEFCGYVDDDVKLALFHLCRAVVFPSYLRAEAFGVTLLEGAMSARSLISAEIGSGTSHINVDGETGLVVPPGCPQALREAMDYLYFNPSEAARMGRNARSRYERLFTGKIMGADYARVYREVLRVDAADVTLAPGSSAKL
jgi:glycosyltransferase involved in cell wall biosynthesis